MSIRRATRFLRRVAFFVFVVAIIGISLVAVEELFHPFSSYVRTGAAWVAKTEQLLDGKSFMGISLGMIVLTFCVCLFPLLLPRVSKAQYKTSTVRGVIASLVFFLTQLVYGWAERYGRLRLLAAMLAAIVVTFVVIEFLSLLMREDEEVSFRTDLLAAAASGLASGIVLKLVEVLLRKV
jgi:hypothetical protein